MPKFKNCVYVVALLNFETKFGIQLALSLTVLYVTHTHSLSFRLGIFCGTVVDPPLLTIF